MDCIKISVIIPVYNTEKYLKECLDSVVNQTLKDIEIIIINDASPDNSISIINDYASNDGRIVVLDKKNNEGVGQARNDGILKATGEFIAFLDSDDLFSNTTVLDRLYNAAKDNNVLIAGGLRECLLPDGNIARDTNSIDFNGISFYAEGLTDYCDFQYDYGYWCYIYSRELLIENDLLFPNYRRFQDPPFFVKAMTLAKKFYVINEYVYRYRIIDSEEKYTVQKTIDQIKGVIDNLDFSKKKKFSKLHYITAIRLNSESCFMASSNLGSKGFNEIMKLLIVANSKVDDVWLVDEGYPIDCPYVLDFFIDLSSAAKKYKNLRNNKFAKTIRKLKPKR